MRLRDALICDAHSLTRTADGYLVGPARIARAGNVQQYLGRELGLSGDEAEQSFGVYRDPDVCLLYTSPSPRDLSTSRMPSSA